MPDFLCATSAAGKINLFVEWRQQNPNRAVLEFVRCENAHEQSATYQLSYRGSQVDRRTFPGLTVTREALPSGVTTGIVDGQPDFADVGIQYQGPVE
jgi:hypothetical protein